MAAGLDSQVAGFDSLRGFEDPLPAEFDQVPGE
jgi:hypothetical protein